RLMRQQGDQVLLTVVGPKRWPLAGSPPPWVDFRGVTGPADVSALYRRHDVLAMPSRFEAFGVVLAEALVAGLPCVARNAFAMPEIVEDGVTGALVASEDPDELAQALRRILSDSGVYRRVAGAREGLLSRH